MSYGRRKAEKEFPNLGGLQRVKEQIGEETIELNQDAGSDKHPDGKNHWGSRQIANHYKSS